MWYFEKLNLECWNFWKIKFKKIGILKNYLKMEVLKLFENWNYERYLKMQVLKLFENSNYGRYLKNWS